MPCYINSKAFSFAQIDKRLKKFSLKQDCVEAQ